MSKIFTSYEHVNTAYNKVRMELWNLGVLWDGSKLEQVPCIYDPISPVAALSGTMGWYDENSKDITFPSVYLPIAALWCDLGVKANALDVFRHEFAHALAHRYPGALRDSDLFLRAFGGPYGKRPARGTDPDDWEDRCVTAYAATRTQEDFAETFMLFVKHKGKIPAKSAKKLAIRKKWKAVAEIVKRVAKAKR